MRRLLLIVALVNIIAAAGGFGWLLWRWLRTTPPADRTPNTNLVTPQQEKDSAVTSGNNPIAITDTPIARYWVTPDGTVVVIDYTGTVKTISGDHSTTTVVQDAPQQITLLVPAPDGTKVLINGMMLNIETKTWVPLPEATTAAAWHPTDSQQLAYLTSTGLHLLTTKTGRSTQLLALANHDWQLSWPQAATIVLSPRPSAAYPGTVWRFNVREKTLMPLLQNRPAGTVLWSPTGWGLHLATAAVIDETGQPLFNLTATTPDRLFITLPGKCAVMADGVLCAVPQQVPAETVFPDDYLKRKVYTNDGIYRVTIDLDQKRARAALVWNGAINSAFDVTAATVNEKRLFFINRYNQKLYVLELGN